MKNRDPQKDAAPIGAKGKLLASFEFFGFFDKNHFAPLSKF